MTRHGSPRKYPRMARVNEVVREAVADEIERLSDPRLGMVTVTGVEVTADLRYATVYYSALAAPSDAGRTTRSRRGGGEPVLIDSDESRAATHDALTGAAPHIRARLGRQVQLKYLPELTFREDPGVEQGARIDAILRELHAAEGDR